MPRFAVEVLETITRRSVHVVNVSASDYPRRKAEAGLAVLEFPEASAVDPYTRDIFAVRVEELDFDDEDAEKLRREASAKLSADGLDLQGALLVLCPYENPMDDPDVERRKAMMLVLKALGRDKMFP